MKALRLLSIGQLELAEVEPPTPAPDQLLVRTGAATICTSDLHDIRNNPFGIELPIVLGHEGAGTVAGVGSAVRGFAVGDRVAAHPVHPCERCAACRAGMRHLCMAMGHFGLNMQGTFAEYFVVRADRARVLPAALDWPLGALMEPVCVCLEALGQAQLRAGQSLLIIGDGPFGILMARLAARIELGELVLAGHEDFRLGFAGGATTINTRTDSDSRAALRRRCGELGYDATILAVADRNAVSDAIELLRPKGRLVVFAPLPGETPVDLFRLLLKELEIVGAVNDPDRLDDALDALADPRLGLAELITHRFALDDYREALRVAETAHHAALKVAFAFPPAAG